MTSLAEATSERDGHRTLVLLKESLDCFQRCLVIQERQVQDASDPASQDADKDQVPSQDESEDMDMTPAKEDPSLEQETWATIVEPVTIDSLCDTMIAQTDALATICTLEPNTSGPDLAWAEEYYTTQIQAKLTSYATTTGRQQEHRLAEAKYRCALANAAFRTSRIDIASYAQTLTQSYLDFNLTQDFQGLYDQANAEIAFCESIRQQPSPDYLPPPIDDTTTQTNNDETAKLRWKHLTTALTCLTNAAKLPPSAAALSLSGIHLRRGDCELMRLNLREPPLSYDLAAKSTPTLLGNAALYYRMAGREAGVQGLSAKEEGVEAYLKGIVVACLEGKVGEQLPLSEKSKAELRDLVAEMLGEGLLGGRAVEGVAAILE